MPGECLSIVSDRCFDLTRALLGVAFLCASCAHSVCAAHMTAPVDRPLQYGGPQRHARLIEASDMIHAGEARRSFGVDGKGLTVAIVDSGLRTTHVDFAGRVVGGVNLSTDYGGNPSVFIDGHGHGTHVAGIIAANGDHKGIAPAAGVLPIKVLSNSGGVSSIRALEDALQWVLDNREARNIAVVNLSLGDGLNHLEAVEDGFRAKIRALREAKVAVVAAAGNAFYTFKSKQGMTWPSIIPETVSVGALYDADIGPYWYCGGALAHSTGSGRITPFSQRLHESTNAVLRTDIFAPGASIRSSGILGDHGESDMQGTSQATPVVAGVILLMQQLHLREYGVLPAVDDLETWLRESGVRINDGDDEDDNVRNTGRDYLRLDALAALRAIGRRAPPAFSSAPSINPCPAYVNHPISFSASVDAPSKHTVSVSWDFGDGSCGTGTSVCHVYAAPGTYRVRVAAACPVGSPVTRDLNLQVRNAEPMEITMLKLCTRKRAPHRDDATLVCSFRWPAGIDAEDCPVTVDIAGAVASFSMDRRGRGRHGRSSLRSRGRRGNRRHHEGGSTCLTVRLRDGDWGSEWAKHGLNEAHRDTEVPIPVLLFLGDRAFTATVTVLPSARNGCAMLTRHGNHPRAR